MFAFSDKPLSPGRALFQSLVIQAVALVVVFGGFGAIGGVVLLVDNPKMAPFILGGGGFCMLGTVAMGALLFGLWNRARYRWHLDAAMAPLNLEASGYGFLGRQYHGQVDGRRVDALFQKGPLFHLWVEAPVGIRAGVAPRNVLRTAVAGWSGYEMVATDHVSDLADLEVRSKNVDWMAQLIAVPGVPEALGRLGGSEEIAYIRNVIVGPNAIKLTLHRLGVGGLTPERVNQWSEDLSVVAAACETLAPPADAVEESALEAMVRTNPNQIQRRVNCAVAVILVGLVGVCTLVPVVVLLLTQ